MKIIPKLSKKELEILETIRINKYISIVYYRQDIILIYEKLCKLGLIRLCKNCKNTYTLVNSKL